MRGVERLHRLPAHAGVPQHRWGVFLNDFDQFIHGRGGWAERAADLGWDTLALFGCHPTRPLDHLNGAGLLWRISGARSAPCRPTGRRSRSTGRSASSIGVPLRPTSCCRGGDRLRERYCSQKEKAHSFLLSVRHSHGAFGRACPIRYPSGRPENPRQSFRPLMKPSPAGLLLAAIRKG